MDFDMSSLPTTTIGVIGAVILAILALVSRNAKRREDKDAELERQISEAEEALRLALEEGRLTDAKALSDRLYDLRKKLGAGRRVPPVRLMCVLAALACAAGCSSSPKKGPEYIVIGERVNILEPGQVITVPELVPPAKKWYMVDNVGLEGWLGIGR